MTWTKHKIADKNDRPLTIWVCGDYEICQDTRAPSTRRGWSDEWLFAVYHKKRYVSAGETLEQAKELAEIHTKVGDDY